MDTEDVYGYEDSYGVSGLPLHYYLSRPSNDIDMKTVIMLVNSYPESMTACEDYTRLKPIDILLSRGIFREFRTYCTTKPVSIDGLRERINKIPHEFYNHVQEHFNLLQMLCSNENVTLEVVEYLLKEYDTNGASRAIDTRYSNDPSIAYPLHFACKSKSCPNSIVQLLIKRHPAALSHVSVIDGGVRIDHPRISSQYGDDNISGIPLHYYLSREENVDLETVKRMVELYPNALLGSENAWYYSTLHAPLDILLMNPSIDNSFEVAHFLIETNLDSIQQGAEGGDSSLHIACSSYMVDPRTIKSITDACPELIRQQDGGGNTPIHDLIINHSYSDNGTSISESDATEIAAIMVTKEPALLKIANQSGALPLHLAARNGKSPQFCKILVDGYKESTRISVNGHLPVHLAAYGNRHLTVKYLFDADPSTLDTHNSDGKLFFRTVQMEGGNPDVKAFLEVQWSYFVRFLLSSTLTVRDSDGQVPLHRALYDNHASLGSIKLLLEANPDSLFIADNNDTLPLHVACGRGSADIVEYLVDYFATSFGEERRPNIMQKKDKWGNTPLHYACHLVNVM